MFRWRIPAKRSGSGPALDKDPLFAPVLAWAQREASSLIDPASESSHIDYVLYRAALEAEQTAR